MPDLTIAMIKLYYRSKSRRKASAVTASPTTVSSNLPPQDDAGPPKKRQKGGPPEGITIKSSHSELERYKEAVTQAAQDFRMRLMI